MPGLDSSAVLRAARLRAGLSQRALASRADTAQSVVARIEGGQTDPSVGTLNRLLDGAGFTLESRIVPTASYASGEREQAWPDVDPQILEDVDRILRLTPEQRLIEVRNVSRFAHAARKI